MMLRLNFDLLSMMSPMRYTQHKFHRESKSTSLTLFTNRLDICGFSGFLIFQLFVISSVFSYCLSSDPETGN